jgi:glycosyltransferase involved in cell wall biosynthesis
VLAAVPAPSELLADSLSGKVRLRFVAPRLRRARLAYARLLPWIVRNRRWLFEQDVVHCHLTLGSVFGALLQSLRNALGHHRPVVVETYHAVGMKIPDLKRALHAAMLKRRDAVALMAEDNYWRAFGARRGSRALRLIPNGISEPDRPTADASNVYRRRLGMPDGAPIVGTIGRLKHERRPDLLLEAFAKISEFVPDAHFLLGGEGPERDRLNGEASRRGIAGRVHLPGLVHDPGEAISIMDLYLTVNVGPVTGIAALEAAFAGVPVVALQLDPNYRGGDDDWIPSWSDADELGARAAALLADRQALAALAARQQRHARDHHGVEAMAQAYERLYEDALAQDRA